MHIARGIVSVQLMTNIDVYLGIKPPGVEPSVFWIRAGIDWRRQSDVRDRSSLKKGTR